MGQTSGDKWEIYDHVETILGRMQRRIAILSMNRWVESVRTDLGKFNSDF